MEQSLINLLLGNAGLAALVGTRINWNTLPQGSSLPSVALHLITGQPDYTYQGRQGLRKSMVQIDCWGGSFSSAIAVKNAVIAALDLISAPLLGVFIEDLSDAFTQGDGPQSTGTVNFHRASLSVRVWTAEA